MMPHFADLFRKCLGCRGKKASHGQTGDKDDELLLEAEPPTVVAGSKADCMMDKLPPELILQIAYCLDAFDIVKLHRVCRRLHEITRDSEFWKRLCFEDSKSEATRKRRDLQFIAPSSIRESARVFELQRRARALAANAELTAGGGKKTQVKNSRHVRAVADWDPSYPNEEIDWYEEYVARHAPLSMGWLQQPNNRHHDRREIRGLGKYDREGPPLVVAPLDDGSVCLWNAGPQDKPTGTAAGAIIICSKPDLCSTPTPDTLSKRKGPSIAECVSVDAARDKAYIAVGNVVKELDLETLQISSSEDYPFSISALSEANHPVPLTVATTHSLHIHDPRESRSRRSTGSVLDGSVECSTAAVPPPSDHDNLSRHLASVDTGNKAPMSQSGPLSIAHLSSSTGVHDGWSGYICVAGRFPSVLTFNRRMFPRLDSAIHSGSRIASITSIPYPLLYPKTSPPENPQAAHTLIACGEYNGKGSLELYPFSTTSELKPPVCLPTFSSSGIPPPTRVVSYKNRTSASGSKLLSVTPQGTRLVFSDSDGGLKWVERDGHSVVRRWNINAYNASTTPSTDVSTNSGTNPRSGLSQLFANNGSQDGGSVVRKIVPLGSREDPKGELALWTGEKIGILGFRPRARFEWDWDREDKEGKEEAEFRMRMRRALEQEADTARIVRGLGLGR